MSARMFAAAQVPACIATDPSCGNGGAVGAGSVGDVAERVHAGKPVDSEVGAHVEATAATAGDPGASSRAPQPWIPPAHTTERLSDLPAVGEHDPIGLDLRHLARRAGAPRPSSSSIFAAYACARSENGASTTVAGSITYTCAHRRVEVVEPHGHHVVDQIGERSGGLHTRRAGADDHEVRARRRRSAWDCDRRPRTR